MNSNEIERFFKEVPNQAPPPVRDEEVVELSFDDAMNVVEDKIKHTDLELYTSLKEGRLTGGNVETGEDVLSLIIMCYITCIRSNINKTIKNPEEQQKAYITLNRYKKILMDIVKLTSDLNFNVDVNSVLCTIHGAIQQHLRNCVKHD